MKYKAGDRVRIKSIDWYNENKDENGIVELSTHNFVPGMSKYCGMIATIDDVFEDTDSNIAYYMDGIDWDWTDEMIEGLVEEDNDHSQWTGLKVELELSKTVIDVSNVESLHGERFMSGFVKAIIPPKGYIFKDENGNVINAQKIVLEKNIIREEQIDNAAQEYIDSDNAVLTYSDGFCEQTDHPFVRAAFKAGVEWADNNVTQDDCSKAPKLTSQDYSNGRFGYQLPAGFKAKLTERELILTPEKPKYPKNLLDCENELNGIRNDRKKLLHKFNELLICRDAYWKIAGDEMGLDGPWEPQDTNTFSIFYDRLTGEIEKQDGYCGANSTLEFPTEEMRDAFYENFKEEIEICKELL